MARSSRRRGMVVTVALAAITALAVLPARGGAALPVADFSAKLSGPDRIRLGEVATYVVTVTNNGPDPWGARAYFGGGGDGYQDSLPGRGYHLEVSSIRSSQGGGCQKDFVGGRCNLGDIAPGASATMTVTVPITKGVAGGSCHCLDVHGQTTPNTADYDSDFVSSNDYDWVNTPYLAPIRLSGLPKGCGWKRSRPVVSLQVVGRTSTKVAIDGHRVALTPSKRFGVPIRSSELRSGIHKLKVVVRDRSGKAAAKLTRRFRTC